MRHAETKTETVCTQKSKRLCYKQKKEFFFEIRNNKKFTIFSFFSFAYDGSDPPTFTHSRNHTHALATMQHPSTASEFVAALGLTSPQKLLIDWAMRDTGRSIDSLEHLCAPDYEMMGQAGLSEESMDRWTELARAIHPGVEAMTPEQRNAAVERDIEQDAKRIERELQSENIYVFEPRPYKAPPEVVMDFASLYPTIMIAIRPSAAVGSRGHGRPPK